MHVYPKTTVRRWHESDLPTGSEVMSEKHPGISTEVFEALHLGTMHSQFRLGPPGTQAFLDDAPDPTKPSELSVGIFFEPLGITFVPVELGKNLPG